MNLPPDLDPQGPEPKNRPPAADQSDGFTGRPISTFRARSAEFWGRHRRLFWMGHSVWALATGVAVLLLARERYGFVPWVVVFLGLTWASTLFFGRAARTEWSEQAAGRRGVSNRPSGNQEPHEQDLDRPDKDDDGASGKEPTATQTSRARRARSRDPDPPSLGQEVTSYLTRSLYQETLFFLLPFYVYSTVLRSPNVLFVGLLAGLAVLSCLDLVFDRWLRTSVIFGLVFFATVAFAAVNLLLPMIGGLPPRLATPLAAVIAVGSAVPLTFRGTRRSAGAWVRLGLAAGAILVVALALPGVIPPVPLRMTSATFASDIDRASLTLGDTVASQVPISRLDGRLVVLVEAFAPSSLPATVRLQWKRDGTTVRTTRELEIEAHEYGFRIWDGLSPEGTPVEPGRYEVSLRTASGRWFGHAEIEITSD